MKKEPDEDMPFCSGFDEEGAGVEENAQPREWHGWWSPSYVTDGIGGTGSSLGLAGRYGVADIVELAS